MGTIVPAYNYLMDKMNDKEDENDELRQAANACYQKLLKYYNKTDLSPICSITTSK